jgi:hypothetical protein
MESEEGGMRKSGEGKPAKASAPVNTPSQKPGTRWRPFSVGRSNGSMMHLQLYKGGKKLRGDDGY